MRGPVSNLLVQLLLDLARAVTLGSKSRRNHGHILPSRLRLPQHGGPGSHIYIPQQQDGPVMPPGTGFPFVASYDSLGNGGGILTRLHSGRLLMSWVELNLSYGRRSVDQFVFVSGSSLGPITRFYPYPFFSDNCFVVLPVGYPLRWEDGSVTYSAIVEWSGHWGPITINYRLIWDCITSSSPLMTRGDYGGGILTRLHTGCIYISTKLPFTII
jgi:hypothetical protein